MKGYDAFVAREHSRAFNAGPICECGHAEELHDWDSLGAVAWPCTECDCQVYEPRDPHEDDRDEPRED